MIQENWKIYLKWGWRVVDHLKYSKYRHQVNFLRSFSLPMELYKRRKTTLFLYLLKFYYDLFCLYSIENWTLCYMRSLWMNTIRFCNNTHNVNEATDCSWLITANLNVCQFDFPIFLIKPIQLPNLFFVYSHQYK